MQKRRNPKPAKLAEVESAKEELQNADMGAFDRAMRALLKISGEPSKERAAAAPASKRTPDSGE